MLRGAFEPWHLLILVLIVVILFGWKKLPDAARSLGRSARILKSEMSDDDGKSQASGQTVPGQTAPQQGGVPGEAQVPGAHAYPQQAPQAGQSDQPAQPGAAGYPQQTPQPGQPGYVPQQQQAPAGYPQQQAATPQGQPQGQPQATGYPQQGGQSGSGN